MGTQLTLGTERGQILIVAVLITMFLAAFGFAMVEAVSSAKDESYAAGLHQERIFLAESALDAAFQDLQRGGSGALGSSDAPIELGRGSFYTLATDRGDGTTTVFAVGIRRGHSRVIRARIRKSKPVFHHAIFAGNSSGDKDYEMKFGGDNGDADEINGDVFSGGSIRVSGDADVTGTARATEDINGMTGETGASQAGFNFNGVNWDDPSIVNVAEELATWGSRESSDVGGTADQLPESNPAHIFRRNPSDRSDEISGTTKDDYFLEDPHVAWNAGRGNSGKEGGGAEISIGDGSSQVHQTFYIDGNLWVHNNDALTFVLSTSAGGGTQVTFIVRGNITFSDNFLLENNDTDAVAFVALKDPDVADSGNIYLGDPEYGTLDEVHAYMYAENDFLDVNLDEKGSKTVRVLGTMSAGNHVAIERDYKGGHSKLTVDWDQRFQKGEVALPLISSDLPSGGGNAVLEAWVESPIVALAGITPPVVGPADPPAAKSNKKPKSLKIPKPKSMKKPKSLKKKSLKIPKYSRKKGYWK